MFSRFFAVSDDFIAQTKQYIYADRRPMVLLVVGWIAVLFVAGLVPALQAYHGFVGDDTPIYAYAVKWLLPIFAVPSVWFALKKRGQNIDSVGFTTKNIWKSLALGAIAFVPLLAFYLALGLRPGEAFFEADTGCTIYRVTNLLIGISLSEELLFRLSRHAALWLDGQIRANLFFGWACCLRYLTMSRHFRALCWMPGRFLSPAGYYSFCGTYLSMRVFIGCMPSTTTSPGRFCFIRLLILWALCLTKF